MKNWILGMTTLEEQNYFEQYAKEIYTGAGEIVDLGCWLGSTTISLASGLSRNRHKAGRKIHAFDCFQWEDYMDDCVRGTSVEGKYRRGDNFLKEFEQRTIGCAELVEVYPVNLVKFFWNAGRIELLLIDAMKSWRLVNVVLQRFFPSLIPGKSYVIQQDYAHYYTSWIHLVHYKLRDYFELIQSIPDSYGFVFQYSREIPPELLNVNYDFSFFSEQDVEAAFQYSMGLTSAPSTRANIASANVMWYLHLNDPEKAKRTMQNYLSSGVPLSGDLKVVNNLLSGN